MERQFESHDTGIRTLIETSHHLTSPPVQPRRGIGFRVKQGSVPYRVKRK